MTGPSQERSRLQVQGRRLGGGLELLLWVEHSDGAWTLHGMGVSGVRLGREVMETLARAVLDAPSPEVEAGGEQP